MATWTNITKNSASLVNTTKNSATIANMVKPFYTFRLSLDGVYNLLIDDTYKFNITETERTAYVSVPKS